MANRPELLRAPRGDLDNTIDALHRRVFSTHQIGFDTVGVLAEPLLRRGRAGLEQPVRVRSNVHLSCAVLAHPDGTRIHVTAETMPDGARFFVPEQHEEATWQLELPELGEQAVPVEIGPVRRWDISLVHHSHFDIGYTDLQGRVIVEQLAFLDDALRLAEAEQSDGPSGFRWSVESIWVLREWIARRRVDIVERFMAQVRAGRIEIAALPFNMHTETCSTEELHGLLRYARDISQRFGVELPVAYQTDVPGCVAGTVDALADAGVKYLAVAHNWAGRSVPYLTGGEHLPSLFRWESPSGNSVLVWMTTSAQGLAYQEGAMLGFYQNVDKVEDLLPAFLAGQATLPFVYGDSMPGFAFGDGEFSRSPYPWNELHLRVMGRIGDNSPPNRRLNEIVETWNERWVYPKLTVTRTQDFFEQIEANHRDEIQTFVGDWNDWWADGIGSAARHMQMNRGAQALLSQVTSVESMLSSEAAVGFADRLERAWESVELFDEHTWGAANPWTVGDTAFDTGADEWHWKAEKAIRAEHDAWLLEQEILSAFAGDRGGGADGSIWVVNTSGSPRSGLVSAFLPESLVHTTATIRLVAAATGVDLAFRERNQINPVHRDAGRFVEFWIDNVPSVGSTRVDIIVTDPVGRPVSGEGSLRVATSPSNPVWQLSNDHLEVHVDPHTGAIRSILDRETGMELVNRDSGFGFNSYVHDRHALRGESNHLANFTYAHGSDQTLLVDRATPTHAAFEDAGCDAAGSWIRYRTFGSGIDAVVTTLRLTNEADFLDIENRLIKPSTPGKEAGFFAFPFALHEPTVRFEISGSVAGTDVPSVPGGAHYMHVVRDWVALHAEKMAAALVTKDAPLIQIGDIALPFAPFPGTVREPNAATVFSWVHNNLWDTNFPAAQGLDMTFHYRVSGFAADSAETAVVRSAELASGLVRPLLAVAADPREAAISTSSQLLRIDDARVRLLNIKRTGTRSRLVALQSLADEEVSAVLTVSQPIVSARQATLLGTLLDGLQVIEHSQVTLRIPRFGVRAMELQFGEDTSQDPTTERHAGDDRRDD